MIPKFKIGDNIIHVSNSGKKSIFTVESILLDKDGYWYREGDYTSWLAEKDLTIYTEPKPKVKKYLWAYKHNGNKGHVVSGYFYKDTEEAKEALGSESSLVRLDWSMIECEE